MCAKRICDLMGKFPLWAENALVLKYLLIVNKINVGMTAIGRSCPPTILSMPAKALWLDQILQNGRQFSYQQVRLFEPR